jgi:hypothetical protein
MSMLNRDQSMPIELRKSEIGPPPEARGIMVGALLGVGVWAAMIALGVAVWGWLR